MVKRLKQILRFRVLLAIASVCSIAALLLAYFSPYVHPETLSFLPLFGLAYWIILLINVVILVFWIFMRSRWAFIVLFFLIVGGRIHFRAFAFGSDEVNTTGTELSVMSYNVRLFDLYNSSKAESHKTKDGIFKYIFNRQPDVVCFQEFYHQDAPTSFVTKDSLIQLLGSVDYHERYSHKLNGRQNFGVALFSKYPIIEKGNVNFEQAKDNFNFCIYADIIKNQDTFRIYNIHLQSIRLQKDDYALFTEEEYPVAEQSSNVFKLLNKIRRAFPVRAKQAKQIMTHIKTSPYPVIVCGDFNDTPLSYCYNQFNTSLTDAFRNTSFGIGKTYAGNIPAGRIDYIFHSPKIGSKNFNIQDEKLSDHYAIDCTLFLKKDE